MERLNQIRQFTQHYPELQGLRMAPLGLFFLVSAVQRLGIFPWLGEQGDLTITLPLLILAFALWFWIGRYYERTFGKVEPLRKGSRSAIVGILVPLVLVGVIILENVLYRNNAAPPFSFIGLTVGAAYLYMGLVSQRWYYTVTGVILLAASFLPWIMGVGLGNPTFGSLGTVYQFLWGGLILLNGLLDHFRVVRAFDETRGGLHAGDA